MQTIMKNVSFVLAFFLLISGCAYGPSYSTLENDIRSGSQRVTTERQEASVFDQELLNKGMIANNPSVTNGLIALVNRLTQVSHRPGSRFTVRLIKDKTPNAFSIGGEYLYVHEGLLTFIGSNNDALAGVLAHEISHDIAGHSARNMSAQTWRNLAAAVVDKATGNKVATAVAGAAGTLALLKYSRGQEQEADILGTVYGYRAGYDPNQFITFFQNLEKQSQIPGYLTFLTDHPAYATRVQTIRLVHQYMRREVTLAQIAAIDRKTADVLATVDRLDGNITAQTGSRG